MTRVEIDWPDADAERARAAVGRLERAGDALRARAFDERLTIVSRVLEDWTRPDSPWRRTLAEALAETTPFAAGTVTEGLDAALRAWAPEQLEACARAELAAALTGERRLVPWPWTMVLAGGSIPMPTILTALIPLVLGSPVLLRETARDPVTADLLGRSLAARDEDLARAFEPIAFPSTDAAALDVVLEAPCIVATGSDETMATIAARLSHDQRFVAYGHRFSIAVLGPELARDPKAADACATGLALDVARWDQLGCLSPVVAYLVGFEAEAAIDFAERLDSALADLEEAMPRGALEPAAAALHASERAEARMRAASAAAHLFEGEQHTLVLEGDARARPAPLQRFLRLLPVETTEALLAAIRPVAAHLSTAALAGFPTDSAQSLVDRLTRLGVSRVAPPGRLQTPPVDWPRDGRPLFTPLARFAEASHPS